MRILSNAYIPSGRYVPKSSYFQYNLGDDKWTHRYRVVLVQTCLRSPSVRSKCTCVYLVLITLSAMARDLSCATLENVTIEHIPRTKSQFASRPIQIIYSFVTLLLELSTMNHTEALSRINAVFYYVMLPYMHIRHQCAKITCVSGEICRSRYCSQYTIFRTMRNYLTSY